MGARNDISTQHHIQHEQLTASLGAVGLMLFFLIVFGGCGGTPKRVGGASLSDANAKAKAQASPSRRGDDREPLRAGVPLIPPPEPEPTFAIGIGFSDTDPNDESQWSESFPDKSPPVGFKDEDREQPVLLLGISGSQSAFEVLAVRRHQSVSLSAGALLPVKGYRLASDLEFTYGELSFAPGLEGFNRGREYTLGVNLRGSLTPKHTALDVSLLLGARGGVTRWSYLTPLPIEDEFGDLRLVQSDWLPTWSLYAGARVALIRTSAFELGTSFRGGVQGWSQYTYAGLFNDLLGPSLYGQLRLDLTFLFR